MKDVLAVREGRMKDVYRDLFPEGPYEDGIVANMIDVAARDISETMSPLPTFTCQTLRSASEAERARADKRTLIANGYVAHSKLQIQMFSSTDWYVTFGYLVGGVEPDYDVKLPRIQFYTPMGAYDVKNRWGITECVFMSRYWNKDDLVAAYPQCASWVKSNYGSGTEQIEVVRYHDAHVDGLFLPVKGGFPLEFAKNPIGKCTFRVIDRPGVGDLPRGQFDDVLAVQVAKARFALLTLEAATKAVEAPIALPMDVVELNIGPDSVLRTATPEKIGRVRLEVPQQVFAQQSLMEADLAKGSRYPNPRTGNIDGSIVTGRGVEALNAGFDTQIRTGQAMLADMLTDLVSFAFEMDETLWPNEKKKLRGQQDGVRYSIEYTPAKDIRGDYTVDVQYGLMAGLDPNRALVFGLQARGDKLISRDFLRRQMPFAINAAEEEARTDIEDMRDSLKEFIAGYAQALPQMVMQGQDPSQTVYRIAGIIKGRAEGTPIEELVLEAFEPEQPGPDDENNETPPGVEPSGAAAPPVPGSPELAPPGGALPTAPPGGGGSGGIQELLAGLTRGGNANLAANVSRRRPIA